MPMVSERLRSGVLGNERTIWIRPPGNPATAKHLTMFLDGEFYLERLGTEAILENLAEKMADSWFVFVSHESLESRWLECPCYPPFAHFVVNELLPWLEKRYLGQTGILERTIVGLSYTGLAAAFIAKEHPGVFQKVVSQSGSFWSNDRALEKAFEHLPHRLPTSFYLSVGTKETQRNVRHREGVLQAISQIEGVQSFRDMLRKHGHDVHYTEFDGAHEFNAWGRTLPDALLWSLPRCSI